MMTMRKSPMTEEPMYKFDDGKYCLTVSANGILSATRYGEPWIEYWTTGGKLIISMLDYIERLEQTVLEQRESLQFVGSVVWSGDYAASEDTCDELEGALCDCGIEWEQWSKYDEDEFFKELQHGSR
jgi:hypothetical protein